MGNRLSKPSQAELKKGLVIALKAAEKCLDGLPIPGVQGCVTGILGLIEQEDLRKSNVETFKGLVARIQGINTFFEERTSSQEKQYISEALEKIIVDLASKLRDIPDQYRVRVGHKSLKRRIRNFVSAGDHAELLNNLAQDLENAIEDFHTKSLLNIQVEAEKRRLEAEEQRVKDDNRRDEMENRAEERRREEERQRGIEKLKHGVEEKAFWNAHREFPTQLCAQGTRVDLLDTIAKWAAGTAADQSPLLWLNGRAGMGKSTIAKTLASRLDAAGILGATFMFSKPNGVADGSKVFTTLAYRLAHHLPEFRDLLADTLNAKEESVSAEIPLQLSHLLATPLSQLPLPQPMSVIIIDALDECSEGTIGPVLSCIIESLTRFNFLRIIITSRPEHPIRNLLQPTNNARDLDLHAVSADGEIRSFLQDQLNKVYHDLKQSAPPDIIWPPPDKLQALSNLAGGLFIFAATAIRFIGDERAGNPDRRLDLILEGQHHGQAKPFAKLDRMYEGILAEALRGDDDDLVTRFQAIVGAIVFSQLPPSINELVELHHVSENQYDADSIRTALKYLHSVVVVPLRDFLPDISVYHKSFADYITDRARCTHDGAFLSPLSHHERLFRLYCKAIIALLTKVDMANVTDTDLMRLDTINRFKLYKCLYHWSMLKNYEPGGNDMEHSLLAVQGATRELLIDLLESLRSFEACPPQPDGWIELRFKAEVNAVKDTAYRLANDTGLHARTNDSDGDS